MTDVLAFDLGGSSLRLAVVSGEGGIRAALCASRCGSQKGRHGAFEVDPADWWDAFVQACQDLRGKGADFTQVRGHRGVRIYAYSGAPGPDWQSRASGDHVPRCAGRARAF